jgi:nitrate reductase gamma subunit
MDKTGSIKYLRVALAAVGVIYIVGIYSLIVIWPSGWSWHSGQSHHLPHYLQMILGVYATLGGFLLIASRDPLKNLSLIWFTVWSNIVHAAIMAAQALANPEQTGHLWGDVPALLVLAGILAFLTKRAVRTEVSSLTDPLLRAQILREKYRATSLKEQL